jgi:hypothetical protein
MALFRTAPAGGAFHRRFTDYSGLFFDEFASDSAWIREEGRVRLPPLDGIDALVVSGDFLPHPEARGLEQGSPGLVCLVNGAAAARLNPPAPGAWELRVPLAPAAHTEHPILDLRLSGTGFTNFLAWLGRITGVGALQRFRRQNRNRQLRIRRIATPGGETVYDFSQRDAPFSRAFAGSTLPGFSPPTWESENRRAAWCGRPTPPRSRRPWWRSSSIAAIRSET